MPSRPSGADKEKERAQNEGSRGLGSAVAAARPIAQIFWRVVMALKYPRRLTVTIAEQGKARVNRHMGSPLLAETGGANQARR